MWINANWWSWSAFNRGSFFTPIQKQVDELTVCPWHRYLLTYGWPGKKRLTCFHPDHLRKCTNQNNARFFNLEMSRIDIGLVQTLLSAHNNTENWQTKHQILSLFVNDLSKTELQEMIPGLSKWWIDQASCHATDVGEGQPIHDKLTFCTQLDSVKMDHFVDYISRCCIWHPKTETRQWWTSCNISSDKNPKTLKDYCTISSILQRDWIWSSKRKHSLQDFRSLLRFHAKVIAWPPLYYHRGRASLWFTWRHGQYSQKCLSHNFQLGKRSQTATLRCKEIP